jgi:hypothetical protein
MEMKCPLEQMAADEKREWAATQAFFQYREDFGNDPVMRMVWSAKVNQGRGFFMDWLPEKEWGTHLERLRHNCWKWKRK